MEFFKDIHHSDLSIVELKKLLSINNLTTLCSSITEVTAAGKNQADIYCLWGAFKLSREEIKNGVRFALTSCPHALAWTITKNDADQNIVLHCTIDKKEEDPDFVDSIEEFVADWSRGISKYFNNKD